MKKPSGRADFLAPEFIQLIAGATQEVKTLFPPLNQGNVRGFVDRSVAHLSLPISMQMRPLWELALVHAANPGDPAYSEHGANGHAVYVETLYALATLLKSDPGKVQFTTQPHRARFGKHNLTADRLVVQSLEAQRPLSMPSWMAVGQQLAEYRKKYTDLPLKTVFRNIEKASSMGFAVLTLMAAGFRVKEIKPLVSTAFGIVKSQVQEALSVADQSLYENNFIVYVAERQQVAARAIAACRDFGSSESELLRFSKQAVPTTHTAVFTSMGEQLIRELTQAGLEKELSNIAQLQVFKEFDGLYSTQLITAYNIYRPTPLNFTDPGSVAKTITAAQ